MTPALFAAAALFSGAASLFAAALWLRSGAYCVLVAALFGLWMTSLGHPRPLWLWPVSGVVLAHEFAEPGAIYVWLRPDGVTEPLSLAVPWSEKRAQQLQHAAQQAKRQPGSEVRMTVRGMFGRPASGHNGMRAMAPQGHGTGASHSHGAAGQHTTASASDRRDDVQFGVEMPRGLPPKEAP